MNVMIRTIILAAVMAAACGLAPCAAQTQEPKVKAKEQQGNVEVQVVPLKYSAPASIAGVMKEMYKAHQVYALGVEHTNSIVVSAPTTLMAEIRQLITQLDKERPVDQDHRYRMRVVQLKNQPDEALDSALKLLISPANSEQYSIDRARRQLVLLARDTTSNSVDEYLARWSFAPAAAVAPPAGDVQIRVVWISSDPEMATARPLPDDLKPLIPAFKKIGLDKPFAAATYTMTTAPNVEFSTVGATYGLSSSIRIAGQYNDRKSLVISIREATQEERSIDINSELTAPLGHLIVLGATTVGPGNNQMAFVVQVTRPDSIGPAANP